MEKRRKFGALSSSENPEALSATVKGAILSVASLILFAAKWLDVPFTETDVVNLATNAGMAAGSLWFLFGVLRKLVVRFTFKSE